jgi:hypothetical protein
MSDKSFKVKSGLVVSALSTAGVVRTDASGVISSSSTLGISEGGTGQSTAATALNALLPLQTSKDNYFLQTNGVSPQWTQITYIALPSTSVSSDITLSSFNKYFVDTTAARTLTLPSSPSLGDEIYVFDASGTAASYNITIARNNKLINGNAGNLIIDVNGSSATFVYTGSTYGWKVG